MNVELHLNKDDNVNMKSKFKIYRSCIVMWCIIQYKYKKKRTMYREYRIALEHKSVIKNSHKLNVR